MKALTALTALATVFCLPGNIAAQEKAEFIFSGEDVVSTRYPENSIRLSGEFSVVAIKRRFAQYCVEGLAGVLPDIVGSGIAF